MVARGYVTWLSAKLPPAAQPSLHDLEAKLFYVIESLPDDPASTAPSSLTDQVVRSNLEFLMKQVASAYARDSMSFLCAHILIYAASMNAPDILRSMMAHTPTEAATESKS